MIPAVNTSATDPLHKAERNRLIVAVWLVCTLFLTGLTIADPDLWGHTLYGLRAIEAGVLTERVDPFSYTASGAEWINHEWLTEYQYGWLWRTCGGPGLVLWRNGLLLILMGIVLHRLLRSTCGLAAAVMLLVLNAETLSDFVVFIRPQVATFALFAVHLSVLRSWWNDRTRLVWCLPILMAVWVNLHGGFLAGLGVSGVYVAGAFLRGLRQGRLRDEVPLLASFTLSVMATFINPYGSELHVMLWHHLWTAQFVREWQPVWVTGPALNLMIPFLLTGLALSFCRIRRWIDVAVLVIVGWQAAMHLRHCALLSIATLILLPEPLTEALARVFRLLTEQWSQPEMQRKRAVAAGLVCLFLAGIEVRAALDLWKHGLRPWDIAVEAKSSVPGMPVRAVQMLKSEGISGRLVTDYGWAQFAIWHLYPETRLAFDGRYRTIYPPQLEAEFLALQQADRTKPKTTPMLDEYGTDIALFSIDSGPDRYLQTRPDWTCILRDEQCALYLRRTGRLMDTIDRLSHSGAVDRIVPARWLAFPGLAVGGTAVAPGEPDSLSEETLAIRDAAH